MWSGAWDSIKSPMNVVKDVGHGNFSDAWSDLKHIPGNQERANSKTLNSFGIRGWVGDHPGETAAAIVASIFGGSAALGGGAASGSSTAGAASGTAGTTASGAAPITAAVGTPTGTAAGSASTSTAATTGGTTMSQYAQYAQLGSSLLNAGSQMSSGATASDTYKTQAEQYHNNANSIMGYTSQQMGKQKSQASQLEFQSLAQSAGSGTNANSVSAVNNRADIAKQGEYNALNTLWSGKTQANQMQYQSNLAKAYADSAKSSGMLGGLSSILGGASSFMKS